MHMDNNSIELTLIESRSARTSAIANFSDDRAIDVLNKAKALVMAVWQGSGIATTSQLAEYYEVPVDTVQTIIKRHRQELAQDGLEVVKSEALKEMSVLNISQDGATSLTVWTPRAALRLGMLLRDSAIAKQLRSTILDIVETARPKAEKPQKPRLQIVTKQRTLQKHVSHANLILGLVPGLDDVRKSVLLLSSIEESFPEETDLVRLAQAALPSVSSIEQSYLPNEIGQKLDPVLSSIRVNVLLEQAGLQTSYRTARGQKKWRATELGQEHSVISIEAKHNGAPTESLRWKASVIELISIRAAV